MSFTQDLTIGHTAEKLVVPRLEAFIPGSEAWRNRLSYWITDAWWRWPKEYGYEKPFKVEVKYDRKCEETQNVALEHHSLLRSTSDYIVYVIPGFICLLDTQTVLEMIRQFPVVRGGDQGYELTLVPKDYFIRNSTLI